MSKLKCYVITVSKNFPTSHKKKGISTRFKQFKNVMSIFILIVSTSTISAQIKDDYYNPVDNYDKKRKLFISGTYTIIGTTVTYMGVKNSGNGSQHKDEALAILGVGTLIASNLIIASLRNSKFIPETIFRYTTKKKVIF